MTTTIAVFEHLGSGEKKIEGIRRYGRDIEITTVVNIDLSLPDFIDNPEEYLDENFTADLVLCFIKHPDISHHLATICRRKNIPMIASGTKTENAITPFTCCGLGRHKKLGAYGEQFGVPEFQVTTREGRVAKIEVLRGASCGATWEVAKNIIGMQIEEALPTLAREVQYLCVADPSAFDPISGKSSLHYAGHVHIAALKKALEEEGKN